MKFTNHASVNGTCLQGYVKTTYHHLVSAFGQPEFGPNNHTGDKVTCEWCLRFEDGTVATIYEWKNGFTPMGMEEWHIGGNSRYAVERVLEVLEKGYHHA
jgi:hypothetical protein